jgi:hypothetical protein
MAFRNGTDHQSYNRTMRTAAHRLMSGGRITHTHTHTHTKAAAILLHVRMKPNGITRRYGVQSESRMEAE